MLKDSAAIFHVFRFHFFLRTMFSTTYLLFLGGWMGNEDHMFFPKNHQNQPFTGLAGATWPMVQLRSTQLLRTWRTYARQLTRSRPSWGRPGGQEKLKGEDEPWIEAGKEKMSWKWWQLKIIYYIYIYMPCRCFCVKYPCAMKKLLLQKSILIHDHPVLGLCVFFNH